MSAPSFWFSWTPAGYKIQGVDAPVFHDVLYASWESAAQALRAWGPPGLQHDLHAQVVAVLSDCTVNLGPEETFCTQAGQNARRRATQIANSNKRAFVHVTTIARDEEIALPDVLASLQSTLEHLPEAFLSPSAAAGLRRHQQAAREVLGEACVDAIRHLPWGPAVQRILLEFCESLDGR